jgi:hypothetical protein
MSEREKIIAWIDSRLRKSPLEIDINHQRGDKVESIELEENETTEDLVKRVFAAAEDDAKGMMGPQVYWILLRTAGTRDVVSRKSITVDGELFEKGRGSESPDEYGLTAQSMRHNEGVMKMAFNAVERMHLNMQRENERMANQLAELSRLEIERMAMSRQLAQDVANQRVEEQRVIAKAKRDEWVMRQAELLLPMAMNKFFGPEEGKGPNWAQEADILVRLASKLESEQIQRVVMVFDPAARALLGQLMAGEISEAFIPVVVQRLMNSLSEDQFIGLWKVLATDEQREIFRELYTVRKHGIDWAISEGGTRVFQAQPRYLPPQVNGLGGNVEDRVKPEVEEKPS